jgi:hypothetical protein
MVVVEELVVVVVEVDVPPESCANAIACINIKVIMVIMPR